ncbi:MAG: DNA-binding transcriptional regulator [Isosphaeraceae bacterium]|nr:DNA-binding transcriptional regulator [Isosphaeraceae bacterium]
MKRRQKRVQSGPPQVALIIETSTAYGRNLLRGVSQYIHEFGPWNVYMEQRSLQDPVPPWLDRWDGDGIISRASTPESAGEIVRTGIPTVDLNDQVRDLGLPQIHSDHAAIARLAATHLMERGFRHFAFFGFPIFEWSVARESAFAQCVREAGFQLHENKVPAHATWGHQQASWKQEIVAVAKWVKNLPKPLGIMAGNDNRGMQLLGACRRAGVAVPEEVAVIGVDNEELACQMALPPLSSVIPDAFRVGYEAAALLDLLIKGNPAPEHVRYVAPLGVKTRQSTDVTAISDPRVADAMSFIREHACEGIGVEDVLDHVAISRTVLQQLFREMLGKTIHDAITETRIQRVKHLLTETDLSLTLIAERAGFSYAEYLSTFFRRATGWTPSAFRREFGKRSVGNG